MNNCVRGVNERSKGEDKMTKDQIKNQIVMTFTEGETVRGRELCAEWSEFIYIYLCRQIWSWCLFLKGYQENLKF